MTLKKLALAAASVATLGMASASAAVVVTDGNGNAVDTTNSFTGTPVLGAGTAFALNFDEGDLDDGQAIDETITFEIGPDVDFSNLTLGVLPAIGAERGAQAGIMNFMAAVSVNGTSVAMLEVSTATGAQNLDNSFLQLLDIAAGDVVTIELTGMVFENFGDDAEYSVNVLGFANPVPVPAAAVLFGTAIAGAAASRRKRKA